jgi:hypothetical protein
MITAKAQDNSELDRWRKSMDRWDAAMHDWEDTRSKSVGQSLREIEKVKEPSHGVVKFLRGFIPDARDVKTFGLSYTAGYLANRPLMDYSRKILNGQTLGFTSQSAAFSTVLSGQQSILQQMASGFSNVLQGQAGLAQGQTGILQGLAGLGKQITGVQSGVDNNGQAIAGVANNVTSLLRPCTQVVNSPFGTVTTTNPQPCK